MGNFNELGDFVNWLNDLKQGLDNPVGIAELVNDMDFDLAEPEPMPEIDETAQRLEAAQIVTGIIHGPLDDIQVKQQCGRLWFVSYLPYAKDDPYLVISPDAPFVFHRYSMDFWQHWHSLPRTPQWYRRGVELATKCMAAAKQFATESEYNWLYRLLTNALSLPGEVG